MMKTTITLHIAILLLVTGLSAQETKIKDREIQVEKKYNTEIYAVEPIFDFASISTLPRRAVSFGKDSLIGISPYAPSMDIKVRPVAYETIAPSKTHKAFIKGDKGTSNIWHGQGGYTYAASNYFTINANAAYDQWRDSNIEDQQMKTIKGSLGVTYYLTNAIKSNINLRYNKHSYGRYGGLTMDDEPTGAVSAFSDYNLDLGLTSFRSAPAAWNYGLQSTIQKWSDDTEDISEINISSRVYANYRISKNTNIELAPEIKISNSVVAGDVTVIGADLITNINTPDAYLTLGANVNKIGSRWSIWPKTDISFRLFDSHKISISSDQSINAVGAAYISQLNPYRSNSSLFGDIPYRPDYKAVTISKRASLDYNISLDETFNVGLASEFSINRNDVNFRVIPEVSDAFEFDYVDYNVIRTQLMANKSLLDNELTASVGITYQHFMDESATLWHRPTLLFNTDLSYQPLNKLHLGMSGRFSNPQQFETDAASDSGWRANVSFELRYDVLDRASLYFNADNILDNRFEVWKDHATYGRNLSAGLLVKF